MTNRKVTTVAMTVVTAIITGLNVYLLAAMAAGLL